MPIQRKLKKGEYQDETDLDRTNANGGLEQNCLKLNGLVTKKPALIDNEITQTKLNL